MVRARDSWGKDLADEASRDCMRTSGDRVEHRLLPWFHATWSFMDIPQNGNAFQEASPHFVIFRLLWSPRWSRKYLPPSIQFLSFTIFSHGSLQEKRLVCPTRNDLRVCSCLSMSSLSNSRKDEWKFLKEERNVKARRGKQHHHVSKGPLLLHCAFVVRLQFFCFPNMLGL